MIRRLCEPDRQSVLQYLYQESSFNIFIIGDIETFGFEQDFQIIYGEFDENNTYKSVLLFYREHSIYYSHLDYFNEDYLMVFEKHHFEYMSGKSTLMKLIQPFLPEFGYKPMYFCKAVKLESKPLLQEETIHHVSTIEDITKLYHLLIKIDEFGIKSTSLDKFIESTKKGLEMGVKLFIEADGKMVSTVATTAETTVSAMVVGVATDPSYRQRGYASKLMISLMEEYFNNRNKELCLFYDNPEAGKIYKRLGFKDIGKWVMMSTVE